MNLHLDSRGRNTDPTLGGRDVYVTMKKEYLGWDTLLDTAILGTYNLLHCPNFYRNALGSWICICKKKRNQNHRGLSFLLSLPPCLPLPCPSFLSVINSTTISVLFHGMKSCQQGHFNGTPQIILFLLCWHFIFHIATRRLSFQSFDVSYSVLFEKDCMALKTLGLEQYFYLPSTLTCSLCVRHCSKWALYKD